MTNGAFHIDELLKYKINTILLGGNVLTNIAVLVGPSAIKQVSNMNFDKCFIGASGITLDNGLSTSNIDVAEINRIVIEKSKEIYFLADSTKIGADSRYVFADINDCNKFITTNQADVNDFDAKKLIVVEDE